MLVILALLLFVPGHHGFPAEAEEAEMPPGAPRIDDVLAQVTRISGDPEQFVFYVESALHHTSKLMVLLDWAYESNITDYNEEQKLRFKKNYDTFVLKLGQEAKKFNTDLVKNETTKRKLKMLVEQIGTSALEGQDLIRYNQLVSDMTKIFSTAKVAEYNNTSNMVSLEPEMTLSMAESRNPEELQHYWVQHRASTGKQIREMYKKYLEFTNKAAALNGYSSGTEMKIQPYESATFIEEMEATWQNLKPLYDQLHAYVRYKLHKNYGCEVVPKTGPLPAHVLGNMWAQSWSNIADLVMPYPDKPSIDVTQEMKRQNWTPKTMFEKADAFFVSMGLEPMNEVFWQKSIIEKPKDREMVCHASAWDFYGPKDFRIKMCTRVNQEDFITVNHEMGHVQYFLRYRNQSYLFRNGANPGFHEAVADILALAVGTPSYYQQLGLLDRSIDVTDKETNINMLFNAALSRLAFMPFGYLIDKYRWDLMSGAVGVEDMNCHWHKLRSEIQGIMPPVMRYEDEFDAGAKFHVAAGIGYVRYFTAHVYQFQFYKALCLASGQYDPRDASKPLHRCNFFGSKEAGNLLVSMLEMGSSKPWKEAMKVMTGQPEMSTDAFREYFKPLEDWLMEENKKNGVEVGWQNPKIEEICQKQKPRVQ